MDRVHGLKKWLTYLVEMRHGAVVGEYPAAMGERMGIFDRRGPYRRPPNMGNNRVRIDARRLLLEVLTVLGGPGPFLDQRGAVGIVSHAPPMTVD